MRIYICILVIKDGKAFVNYNNEYFPSPYSNLLSLPTLSFFDFENGSFLDEFRKKFSEKLRCNVDLERPSPYLHEEKRGGRYFLIFKGNFCGGKPGKVEYVTCDSWMNLADISALNTNEWVIGAIKHFQNL